MGAGFYHLSPFQGSDPFIERYQGLHAPLRDALAPGYLMPSLRHSNVGKPRSSEATTRRLSRQKKRRGFSAALLLKAPETCLACHFGEVRIIGGFRSTICDRFHAAGVQRAELNLRSVVALFFHGGFQLDHSTTAFEHGALFDYQ